MYGIGEILDFNLKLYDDKLPRNKFYFLASKYTEKNQLFHIEIIHYYAFEDFAWTSIRNALNRECIQVCTFPCTTQEQAVALVGPPSAVGAPR